MKKLNHQPRAFHVRQQGEKNRNSPGLFASRIVSSCRPCTTSFLLGASLLSAGIKHACWKGENTGLTYLTEIPYHQGHGGQASGQKAIHHSAQLLAQGSWPWGLWLPTLGLSHVACPRLEPQSLLSPWRVPSQVCVTHSLKAPLRPPANPSSPLGALQGRREPGRPGAGRAVASATLMGAIAMSCK